jgi:hypothetical protein
MMEQELQSISMPGYKLASSYCREKHLKGGVCIFVKENVLYQTMDLRRVCREKTFGTCAVKLQIASTKLIVLCIYRAPSGNLNQFIELLDSALKQLYQLSVEFLICGDININYLIESNIKKQLDSMMNTYNLIQIVNFSTRTSNDKGTQIDNMFFIQ